MFMDAVHAAKHAPIERGDMPGIEASSKIVRHFNRGRLEGLESAGYFIYEGVKVFEEGKRDEAEARDRLTSNDKVFGGKSA